MAKNTQAEMTRDLPPLSLRAAISPAAAMTAIWQFDNANQRFMGYSTKPGAPNDLSSVNRGDAVFVCMNGGGSLARPEI